MKAIKFIVGITFIMTFVIIGGYFLIIGLGINALSDEADSAKALKEELIGVKILVQSDTLIVTEFTYNPLGSTITAVDADKNAITLDVTFAQKNKIK